MNDGREDIRRAAAELAERLPDAPRAAGAARLQLPLVVAARRRRSCSRRSTPSASSSSSRTRCGCSRRPRRRRCGARPPTTSCSSARRRSRPGWRPTSSGRPTRRSTPPARSAFLCAEYGVHVSLPVYSGGLGALAGDLLKEASDRALPMVAVGLMYRKGYFRQRIDAGGWQHEYWVDTDPQRLPAALVTGADGQPLTIEVPIYDADVTARIWRVDVGRVPLFLLDTDCPGERADRALDHRPAVRGRRAHPPRPVRAARRRRHAGAARARDRAGRDPPERGPRGARAARSSPCQELRAGEPLAVGARRGARADRVHHPHAGARRQRHLSARAGRARRSAGSPSELGCPSEELIALGRTRSRGHRARRSG